MYSLSCPAFIGTSTTDFHVHCEGQADLNAHSHIPLTQSLILMISSLSHYMCLLAGQGLAMTIARIRHDYLMRDTKREGSGGRWGERERRGEVSETEREREREGGREREGRGDDHQLTKAHTDFFTWPWPAVWAGQGHPLHKLRSPGRAYLAVETNDKQHEEEENGPQRGDGQLGHCLRVRHEGQTRSWSNKGTIIIIIIMKISILIVRYP